MRRINSVLQIFICVMVLPVMASCGHVSAVQGARVAYQKGDKESLIKILENPDPAGRAEAISLLVDMNECSSVTKMHHDIQPLVRSALAKKLVKCNTEEAKTALIAMVEDDSAEVRKNLPESLILNDYCRSECLFRLRKLIDDKDPIVKLQAATILYNRFPDEARAAVLDCLSSRITSVRLKAIKKVSLFKKPDDIYYLGEFLEDRNDSIRVAARREIEEILGHSLSGGEYQAVILKKPLNDNIGQSKPSEHTLPSEVTDQINEKARIPQLEDFGMETYSKENPDAIGVIIGNKDYGSVDIPDVKYALRDAAIMRHVYQNIFGVKDENLIYVENAKTSDFNRIFGTVDDPKGLLYNWARPSSEIYIYYSGHGAPDINSKQAYLVPVDSDINYISLSGYSMLQLYDNLEKLKVKNVFIFMDSCFSGITHAGSITSSASPVFVNIDQDRLKSRKKIVTFSSSGPSQVASWDEKHQFGLFTYFFVKGFDEGDLDSDGMITMGEMASYLKEKVSYYARRTLNREQVPCLSGPENIVLFQK